MGNRASRSSSSLIRGGVAAFLAWAASGGIAGAADCSCAASWAPCTPEPAQQHACIVLISGHESKAQSIVSRGLTCDPASGGHASAETHLLWSVTLQSCGRYAARRPRRSTAPHQSTATCSREVCVSRVSGCLDTGTKQHPAATALTLCSKATSDAPNMVDCWQGRGYVDSLGTDVMLYAQESGPETPQQQQLAAVTSSVCITITQSCVVCMHKWHQQSARAGEKSVVDVTRSHVPSSSTGLKTWRLHGVPLVCCVGCSTLVRYRQLHVTHDSIAPRDVCRHPKAIASDRYSM